MRKPLARDAFRAELSWDASRIEGIRPLGLKGIGQIPNSLTGWHPVRSAPGNLLLRRELPGYRLFPQLLKRKLSGNAFHPTLPQIRKKPGHPQFDLRKPGKPGHPRSNLGKPLARDGFRAKNHQKPGHPRFKLRKPLAQDGFRAGLILGCVQNCGTSASRPPSWRTDSEFDHRLALGLLCSGKSLAQEGATRGSAVRVAS